MAIESLKSGRIFDSVNSFMIQTVTFDTPQVANDTFKIYYDSLNDGDSATITWAGSDAANITNITNEINTLLNTYWTTKHLDLPVGTVKLSDFSDTGFVVTFKNVNPIGYLKTDTASSGNVETSLVSKIINATDRDMTLFALSNGTDKDIGITYQGSFDGGVWWDLGTSSLTTTERKARESLTEPWPKIRVIAVPVDEFTINSDELLITWWGAN